GVGAGDGRDAGAAQRAARPGPAAEGVRAGETVSLDAQPPVAGPQVGADEWVARRAQRREYLPSWLGTGQRQLERIGWWPRLAIAGLAGALLPLVGLGGFRATAGFKR